NLYYRFGAFGHFEIGREGQRIHAVHTPTGELAPDNRHQPNPDWVSDPFAAHKPRPGFAKKTINSSVRVMKVLSQRGKGGVYEAIDLRGKEPRLCLLKEGRKHGEVTWDG